MTKILLTTVRHSFTESVLFMLKEEYDTVIRAHTWPDGITKARTGDYIVMTTYRNPRDVANSWIKRKPDWRSDLWRAQWRALAEIIPMAKKIYQLEDLDRKLGTREEHRKDHSSNKHNLMEADIQYAEDICKEVLT